MMTKSELIMHLNRMLDILQGLRFYTKNISEKEFLQNQALIKRAHNALEEVGWSAKEISWHFAGSDKKEFPQALLSQLSSIQDIRLTKLNHQEVFEIIKNDLYEIREDISTLLNELTIRELTKV